MLKRRTMWICYSGCNLRIDHGVFDTEADARAWAARADKWRGADHPLTPHRVESMPCNPPLFPDFGADDGFGSPEAGLFS